MQTYLSEGIVLNVLNFREVDQIVTVFTENEGVMKFFSKRGNAGKKECKSLTLTRAEFVYTIGKSELYPLQEISPKEHFLQLRQNLKDLTVACEFLKSILDTQMMHKPAPYLYKLLIAYLSRISGFANYEALESSFRLKILNHEGILDLSSGSFFSEQELYLVYQLTIENSFANLQKIEISQDLNFKIQFFFKESILC